MHRMSPLSAIPASTLALLSLLSIPGTAHAQDSFDGFYLGGTSVAVGSQGRNTSGHLIGNGYSAQHDPTPNTVQWSGQGSHTTSVPLLPWVTTPVSAEFRSEELQNTAGATYSGGSFALPAAAAFPAVVLTQLHLYSVLDENAGGERVFSEATFNATAYTDSSASRFTPLHWRIDWRVTTTGDAILSAYVELLNGNYRFDLAAGAGSYSGVFGADAYPQTFFMGDRGLSLPVRVLAGTNAGDMGSYPGQGRVDLWADIRFSREAIVAIPEPGTWAMLGAGLLTVGWVARRRS